MKSRSFDLQLRAVNRESQATGEMANMHAFCFFATFLALMIASTEALLNKNCPFTMDQCKTEPYNKLRSCKLATEKPEKLNDLSSSFLCSERDVLNKNERTKRSSGAELGNNHTVSKRSTSGTCNLCMTRSLQQIIYAAEDAEYGTNDMLELLHNPAENLYQTYEVQICDTTRTTTTANKVHRCGKQMIEFQAAVFLDDDSVRVQKVRYPTNCAFQYDC